mgnify:CR=1 FL=1
MELLIAILCYFGLMSYDNAGMTPAQSMQLVQSNQSTVQYYYYNQDQLQLDASRVQIDRAED